MERTQENCIHTYTGKKFWPLNARQEDICIEDIAHALSQKCRYTGHTCLFYSVAQHCVHASENCEDARWALMHDAAEAYLPDVSRPIKPVIGQLQEIEDNLLRVIAAKFGLVFHFQIQFTRLMTRCWSPNGITSCPPLPTPVPDMKIWLDSI